MWQTQIDSLLGNPGHTYSIPIEVPKIKVVKTEKPKRSIKHSPAQAAASKKTFAKAHAKQASSKAANKQKLIYLLSKHREMTIRDLQVQSALSDRYIGELLREMPEVTFTIRLIGQHNTRFWRLV